MSCLDRFYEDVTPERYFVLRGRFDKFIANLDKDVEPVRVFDPLKQSQLDQLRVIREVSQELQKNKEEDLLKAKQAAEEASKAEAEASKAEEEAKENQEKEGEEVTEETEKKQ